MILLTFPRFWVGIDEEDATLIFPADNDLTSDERDAVTASTIEALTSEGWTVDPLSVRDNLFS